MSREGEGEGEGEGTGASEGASEGEPSDARALTAAAALLGRIERRELYRFAGSVDLMPADALPPLSTVAEQLCALSGGRLEPSKLRLDVRRVSCGRGAHNPLECIHFFDNKADRVDRAGGAAPDDSVPWARSHPSALYAARLPSAFEERSLRVFVTEDGALGAARDAFTAWCEARELCNEACEIERVLREDAPAPAKGG